MIRFVRTTILVAAVLSIVAAKPCLAERRALSKPSERHFEVRPTDWFVGLKLTGGMVVGEIADRIEDYSDSFSDKLWYGFAIEGDYFVNPKIAVGANLELGWKSVGGENAKDVRLLSYSGHALYRFSADAKSTLFIHPEVGVIKGTWPRDTGDDRDLGSHAFVSLGLGHWYHTGSTTVLRMEVYYKQAFSKDAELFGVSDVDVQGLGVSMGLFKGF